MTRAFKLLQQVLPNRIDSPTLKEAVVDLGSYRTRIMRPDDVEPLSIATCMVISRENQTIISVGEDAREVVGRNSPDLEVISPVQESFFSDYRLSKLFLQYCLGQLVGATDFESVVQPDKLYFFVTPTLSEVQFRALKKICNELGAHRVSFLLKPMVASLATQMSSPSQTASSLKLLIDCGYDSTSFSILQFGKVFYFHQVWFGGRDLTESLQSFLKTKHHLEIGSQSAERLKQECAQVLQNQQREDKEDILVQSSQVRKVTQPHMIVIRGRDVMTGYPKSIKVSAEEFRPLLEQFVQEVIEELAFVTERFGPELMEELIHRGFAVFGGMAVVRMLIQQIEERYGTLVYRPERPDLIYFEGFKQYTKLSSKDRKNIEFSPEW